MYYICPRICSGVLIHVTKAPIAFKESVDIMKIPGMLIMCLMAMYIARSFGVNITVNQTGIAVWIF